MVDLSARLVARFQAHLPPGLSLGEGFLYPDYGGGSILNIPDTICRLLGAPDIGHGPLLPEMWAPLADGVRQVLLILVDALALHRLQRWMAEGDSPLWSQLVRDGLLSALTSVVPSTTSSALTTLWTGRSPAEHAIIGYEMWLKEYGIVANTILQSPMTFQNDAGSLARAGFDPQRFLALPVLGMHLAAHGVKTHVFQHASIHGSGLSRMFQQDAERRPFNTYTDLWTNVRQLWETAGASERRYTYVYWGEVDHFSHRYGPDDERPAGEFSSFSQAFERFFLSRLSPARRKNTLVLLCADHGMIATPQLEHYNLRHHPGLLHKLHILPTCENRLALLFLRPGQGKGTLEYIDRTWPGHFSLLDSRHLLDSGLLGPGRPHPALRDRIGDYAVFARQDAYWWWQAKENYLLGRHGGLDPQEMLVPFLAVRI